LVDKFSTENKSNCVKLQLQQLFCRKITNWSIFLLSVYCCALQREKFLFKQVYYARKHSLLLPAQHALFLNSNSIRENIRAEGDETGMY